MDTSTIGRSAEEFFERCDHCDIEFGSYPDSDRMIYSSCEDVVCNRCMERSPNTCPICLTSDQDGHEMYAENLINEMESLGCTILTVEDQDEIELERIEYEDNMVVLGRQLHAALEQLGMEKNRHKMELEDEKNQARIELEKVKMEKNRLEMELTTERNKAKIEHEKVKKGCFSASERDFSVAKNPFHISSGFLTNEYQNLRLNADTQQKGCFSCNECHFLVAEYRSRICIDCGLSSGYLTKEDQNLRLIADTQQIEKEILMCVGCAMEGFHAGHQTVNYQQLKLGTVSKEQMKKNDSELAEKRDILVSSQTMVTVARLLQTARVELSILSEQTVNAITWDEFISTWNSADIELSRAHSITENFLNVADDTEKSLEKVVAGLGAIRTGCKVFVKNSGKADISKGALFPMYPDGKC